MGFAPGPPADALVVQHTATEGPGWLAEWLPAAGVELRVLAAYAGQPVPEEPTSAALIVLGGPMGATDDADVPWLAATRQLMCRYVDAARPVLGICLGAQLLATAYGGRVARAGGPEIGVSTVELAPAADTDPLLAGLPRAVPAVQWHYDEVTDLPLDAAWLAASTGCAHQAFRVGSAGYGLQFHPEVTLPMLTGWARSDAAELRRLGLDPVQVVGVAATAQGALAAVWEPVVTRFAGLVRRTTVPAAG